MQDVKITIDKKILSHLTHELKNPIAAMQLYLELLLQGAGGAVSDKQKDMLHEIEQSNQKLIKLIDEFRKDQLSIE